MEKNDKKDRNIQSPVGEYFSQNHHSTSDLAVLIVKGNLYNTFRRQPWKQK